VCTLILHPVTRSQWLTTTCHILVACPPHSSPRTPQLRSPQRPRQPIFRAGQTRGNVPLGAIVDFAYRLHTPGTATAHLPCPIFSPASNIPLNVDPSLVMNPFLRKVVECTAASSHGVAAVLWAILQKEKNHLPVRFIINEGAAEDRAVSRRVLQRRVSAASNMTMNEPYRSCTNCSFTTCQSRLHTSPCCGGKSGGKALGISSRCSMSEQQPQSQSNSLYTVQLGVLTCPWKVPSLNLPT